MAFKTRALARFEYTVLNSTGAPVSGASVEIRRQGATCAGAQGPSASPATINVDHVGATVVGDTVVIGDSGATSYNIDTVTESNEGDGFSLTLSGASVTVADLDRITITSALPTLYTDAKSSATLTNALTTNADGAALCWLPPGFYDLHISGAGLSNKLIQDYWIGRSHTFHIDVTAARYGALFDGSTDDTAAINKAFSDATIVLASSPSTWGAYVECPPGIAIISSQLRIPNRCHFVGQGSRSTWLKMDDAFPINTAMINIGDVAQDTFHTTIEHIGLDCSDSTDTPIAGSIGITSQFCQEGSGPRNVLIQRFADKGIHYTTSGCQNWVIGPGLQLLSQNAAAYGMYIDTSASNNRIFDCTINSIDATQSSNPAIYVVAANIEVVNCHVERYDVGVQYDTGATGMVTGFFGHSSITDCVKIDQPGVMVFDINQASATNAVNDTTAGGNGTFNMNSGGFYMAALEGPASLRTILSAVAGTLSRMSSNFQFTGNLLLDTREDIASSDSIALPATGNYFRLTGTTTVNTITGGTTGQIIFLTTTSNCGIGISGNIVPQGGAGTLAASALFIATYDGTNWNGTSL